MEEKKQLKISIWTLLCIFIIMALIVALIVVYAKKEELEVANEKLNETTNGTIVSEKKEIEKSVTNSEIKTTKNVEKDSKNDIEDKAKKDMIESLKGTTWNSKTAYVMDENGNSVETSLYDLFGRAFASVEGSYLTLNSDGTFLDYVYPMTENDINRKGNWNIREWTSEEGKLFVTIILNYVDGYKENESKTVAVNYSEDYKIEKLEYNANEYGTYEGQKIILTKK